MVSHLIIYPLTARVVGASQMISQPVSSIFPFSTALWDLANSRPVHSLMLSRETDRDKEAETYRESCGSVLYTLESTKMTDQADRLAEKATITKAACVSEDVLRSLRR